jgi:hypothetical protein
MQRFIVTAIFSLIAPSAFAHGTHVTTSAAVSGASASGIVGGSAGKGFVTGTVSNVSGAKAFTNGKTAHGTSRSQSAIDGASRGRAGFIGAAGGGATFRAKGNTH